MERMDYQWHYYIGGNCVLKRRKYGGAIAAIDHAEQGVYEAFILRDHDSYKAISVGVFNDSNEAQNQIETILGDIWEK